jgi:hypothetical protein
VPASSVTLALPGAAAVQGGGVFDAGLGAFTLDLAATAAAATADASAGISAVWSRRAAAASSSTDGPTTHYLWYHRARAEWSLSPRAPSQTAPRFAYLPSFSLNLAAAAGALGVTLPAAPSPPADAASGTVPDVLAPRVLRTTRGMLPVGAQEWQGFAGWPALFVAVPGVAGSAVLFQVDFDGLANGVNWKTVVTFEGVGDPSQFTADNFTGKVIYDKAVALLQPDAHAALMRAADLAEAQGLGLRVYDAYRPLAAAFDRGFQLRTARSGQFLAIIQSRRTRFGQ